MKWLNPLFLDLTSEIVKLSLIQLFFLWVFPEKNIINKVKYIKNQVLQKEKNS